MGAIRPRPAGERCLPVERVLETSVAGGIIGVISCLTMLQVQAGRLQQKDPHPQEAGLPAAAAEVP